MRFSTVSSLAALIACTSAQNITALLANTSSLSTLTSILEGYPSLLSTLANATNVTIFAPNNDAFSALMSSGALAAANSSYPDFVPNLIQYHVLNQTVFASQISAQPIFGHTLLNSTIYANITGGQVVEARTNGSDVDIISGLKSVARVVQANVNFTGGVVHIIDSVLTIPANVSTTASDAGLSAFAGAVALANLTDAVNTAKDVTIFAPSNAAFEAIGSALGNLTASQLTSILETHVVNGSILYSTSLGNVSTTTLNGNRVNVTVESNGAVFVNQARVIVPDILIANGVLHVIDSVLNPNSTGTTPSSNSTSPAIAFPGASSASDLSALTSTLASPTTTVAALTSTTDNAASGYTTTRAPGGTASSNVSGSSTGGAVPMATAAMAGVMAAGGWVALMAQM